MSLRELDSSDSQLALEIPSATRHLEALLDRVAAFLDDIPIKEELAYTIQLLVSEAAANAIKHGNRDDPDLRVRVTLRVLPKRLRAEVRDEGEGFKREDVDDPIAEDNLIKSGGRGLFLMESMADAVTYADEGRTIRLTFNRDG